LVKELVRSTKKNPPAKVGVDVIYVSVVFGFWFGIGCGMEGDEEEWAEMDAWCFMRWCGNVFAQSNPRDYRECVLLLTTQYICNLQTGKAEYDASKKEDEAVAGSAGRIFEGLRADLDG
jgi:hypothetical protein